MAENYKYPPKILSKILGFLLTREMEFGAINDYGEQYGYYLDNIGKLKAVLWNLFQIIFAIPKLMINSSCWGFVMFKNN